MSFVSSPDVRLPGTVHNTAQSHLLQRWRSSPGHVSRGRCWTQGHVILMKPLRRFNKWIILSSWALYLLPEQFAVNTLICDDNNSFPPCDSSVWQQRVTAACDTQPAWHRVTVCDTRHTGGSCTWPGPGHLLSQPIRRLQIIQFIMSPPFLFDSFFILCPTVDLVCQYSTVNFDWDKIVIPLIYITWCEPSNSLTK